MLILKKLKTFEFGAAAGLTLNVTKNLFIQGRYVLGLTEATKDAEVENSVVSYQLVLNSKNI
jgi:hypothetical protein